MSRPDPHALLVGHPPVADFIGYINDRTTGGLRGNDGALMDAWRAANDHVRELEKTEAGFADGMTVGELPDDLERLALEVLADPSVQRDFALAPISIEWIELDRLVVFQKHINLAFVDELVAALGDKPGMTRIFDFALPHKQRDNPPIQESQVGETDWTFQSVSRDLRVLGAELLRPAQVAGLNATGVPEVVVALTVGYGSNYLSALAVEGRFVLNNGSHRAYALRAAGHTHVPCLVQHVSGHEELPALAGDKHALITQHLKSKRPPLFKDYFDEKLRMIVNVPASVRELQVGFNLNVTDHPA